jgi:hypothetical protein
MPRVNGARASKCASRRTRFSRPLASWTRDSRGCCVSRKSSSPQHRPSIPRAGGNDRSAHPPTSTSARSRAGGRELHRRTTPGRCLPLRRDDQEGPNLAGLHDVTRATMSGWPSSLTTSNRHLDSLRIPFCSSRSGPRTTRTTTRRGRRRSNTSGRRRASQTVAGRAR